MTYKKIQTVLGCIPLLIAAVQGQWTQMGGPHGCPIVKIAVYHDLLFAGSMTGGVYRSTDNGTSWNEVNDSGMYELSGYDTGATGKKRTIVHFSETITEKTSKRRL